MTGNIIFRLTMRRTYGTVAIRVARCSRECAPTLSLDSAGDANLSSVFLSAIYTRSAFSLVNGQIRSLRFLALAALSPKKEKKNFPGYFHGYTVKESSGTRRAAESVSFLAFSYLNGRFQYFAYSRDEKSRESAAESRRERHFANV